MDSYNIPKVALRGGFSERMGLRRENTEIQILDFDKRTRVAFINEIEQICYIVLPSNGYVDNEVNELIAEVLRNVYVQEVQYGTGRFCNIRTFFEGYVYQTIRSDSYGSVLDTIEYLVGKIEEYRERHGVVFDTFGHFNKVLEKEYVGYRFIGKIIVPITDSNEVKEIEETLSTPFSDAKVHIEKSLCYLSDRDNPDYENSIKESITAVESICTFIRGKKGTLSDALKALEKEKPELKIHPALKDAFI